ncbi:hypothetical protein BR93DRAFT_874713 [Coniochaeta sp. PMI_546]|nr:hypothetical protein BR93DRAFT_874713 [Coniochaeta sp. PMI_546]
MEEDERDIDAVDGMKKKDSPRANGSNMKKEQPSASATPNGSDTKSPASSVSPDEIKPGSDSVSTPDQPPPPKLSRSKSAQKIQQAPAMLFDHLPDATEESCKNFQVINDCLYGSKHMGSSQHDALDCDCAEEWHDGKNHACGEDSDCINRATKMECVDRDCNCGDECQNQRFQKKQYAKVSVIKTEKKGYGLRADTALQANDFIFEYIGEVINEPTFRRRMLQYDEEGIKHFYFMSLTKSEFVDATKKGNLGRFCNHSCNPNCYVDKWVVGDKLRMGIFAGRSIRPGEELVFNYNVDRYGADPQPCYCGEPNCTGYIGGKTQTERATKLPQATIEALGIDDSDSWDTAVAKKPRRKKPTEDDEEYVNSVQPVGLDEAGVTKVMAALMQCKEKWIAVKLLSRIQNAEDDRVRHQVVRMHGYQILKTTLDTFMDDTNVVLQILDILYKLPRLTRNKITDAKIEGPIERLTSSDHADISFEAKRLLDVWSKLETAYRIPRKKHDSSAPTINAFDERRNMGREEESKPDPFANKVIPKGPRSNVPQRNMNIMSGALRPRKLPPTNIPAGWFITTEQRTGKYYFYNLKGETTWVRPTVPCVEVPNAASKVQEKERALQDIIDSLTKERTPRPSAAHTPQQNGNTPAHDPKKEKWRSLPIEKQQKIYENTLFPHVRHVMNKYTRKLPKDELKRLAKEISKKLVASDYKNNRVSDPTMISSDRARGAKRHVKEFLDKAVLKFKEHERRKAAEREAKHGSKASREDGAKSTTPTDESIPQEADKIDDEVVLTDVEDDASPTSSTSNSKRKREEEEIDSAAQTPSETPSAKRIKEDDADLPSPPPPPPPPPEATADALPETPMTEEERSMREQEEALMRENEEAQRLADEAERTKHLEEEAALERENEEAMRDFELTHNQLAPGNGPEGKSRGALVGGNGMDLDEREDGSIEHNEARKQEVLSH